MPSIAAPLIAVFVTPHGFGHATRTCAVLQALSELQPDLRFELFTTVPRWLFEASLSSEFGYHSTSCDVGLVQTSALAEDVGSTVVALEEFLDQAPQRIEELGRAVSALGCRAVLCDVAPLGLAVATHLQLPSVLVENFVWSWVYEAYLDEAPSLEPSIDIYRRWEAMATLHIAAEPNCRSDRGEPVGPIFRRPQQGRDATRSRLGITADQSLVLLTMGGIPWDFGDLKRLEVPDRVVVVVPGGGERFERHGRVLLLPRHSSFYHPDLMTACDGVLGKLGYSTVAEAWGSGVPLGFIPRGRFPESPLLARFAEAALDGFAIQADDLGPRRIGATVTRLLERSCSSDHRESGAGEAARTIFAELQFI